MGKLNKKIVIRVTRRQLEHIVLETIKQKKNISQVVRKALNEQLTSIEYKTRYYRLGID
jgi:predicted HicB family RNase H-like nuclease